MTLRRGKESAAAAVWKWRGEDDGARARRQRIGGVVRGLVGAAIGGLAFMLGQNYIAYIAWSISALQTTLALASPLGGYEKVLDVVDGVSRVVGRIVGWTLLTPVYFFFFVPFRVLFRRGARDRLTRRIDPDAESYWETRDADKEVLPLKRPY